MSISLVCLLTGQAIAGVGTTLFLSAHAIVGLAVLAGGGFDIACDDQTKDQIATSASYKIKKYFGADENKPDSPFIKQVKQILMNRNAGYFLLPANGDEELVFGELTPQQAEKIGINKEEMEEFNNNTDEINAVLETVTNKITEIANKEGVDPSEISYKQGLRAWRELGDLSAINASLQTCLKIIEYELNVL